MSFILVVWAGIKFLVSSFYFKIFEVELIFGGVGGDRIEKVYYTLRSISVSHIGMYLNFGQGIGIWKDCRRYQFNWYNV